MFSKSKYYLIALSIFLLGCFLGLFLGLHETKPALKLKPGVLIASQMKFTTCLMIFKRNLFVAFLLVFGGIISFSIITILVLFWNGILFGLSISETYNDQVVFLNYIRIFYPHAVTEILSFLIFSAIAFKGRLAIVNYITNSFSIERVKNDLILFLIGSGLLFVSALIETYA